MFEIFGIPFNSGSPPQIRLNNNFFFNRKKLKYNQIKFPMIVKKLSTNPLHAIPRWDAQPHEFDGGGTQRAVDWAMTAVYSLVSLFGIVGNILVVIVVRTVPGMVSI